MRARVAGFRTEHSLIRTTFHPAPLSDRATRRSLRLLVSILSRQNALCVLGRYLQRQPCQKQPSTKTATLGRGHAKSGLPATGQCLR
jgi:hypothetical protein